VQTSVSSLLQGGTDRTEVFEDLGTASGVYGSTTVSSTQVNQQVAIGLSNAFASDVRTAAGSTFAVGGAINRLAPPGEEYLFGFTTNSNLVASNKLIISYADSAVDVTPSLNFGNVLVGTQSSPQDYVVTNVGDLGSVLTGSFAPLSSGPFSSLADLPFVLSENETGIRPTTFSPTIRGESISTTGVSTNAGDMNSSLQGRGVAPVATVDASEQFGLTRIGSTSTVSVTVANVGDGNLSGLGAVSNLQFFAGGSGGSFDSPNFNYSMVDATSLDLRYTYHPTSRSGPESHDFEIQFLNGSADGQNLANDVGFTLTGQAVGPIAHTTPLDLAASLPEEFPFDFGEVNLDEVSSPQFLTVQNITTDSGSESLVGLTLVDAYFVGGDTGQFRLTNFTPGTVLSPGESFDLGLEFSPLEYSGYMTTQLWLVTDEGAAFGNAGRTLYFDLRGKALTVAVPEPTTKALAACGALLMVAIKRIRRRSS
ncbi:ASH domain-containing protein, partial [Durusdinium trenchii]